MLRKAGKPGWGGFLPLTNIYLQITRAGRSGMLPLLYVVPIVNIVVAIVVALGVTRAFVKGALCGFLLLVLLQPIDYLILRIQHFPPHRNPPVATISVLTG